MAASMEEARFLTYSIAKSIGDSYETPLYVYDEQTLKSQTEKALAFPNQFGLKVRFAMKSCPNAAILKLFSGMGLNFDASSGFEVLRAMKAGVPASDICLSSQEQPRNFKEIYELGIEFNACSLNQFETFGKLFPGGSCGVRFNPGKGSGGTGKTNVGGPSSSFGIWFEQIPQVKAIAAKYNINIKRIHTHIGSGSDPEVWKTVSAASLDLVRQFPDVHTLNLGGGYKVGRMSTEKSTDLQNVGEPVKDAFIKFAEETGREIKLEIEPGTFLVANAGTLLTRVQDIVSTGADGYTFIKLDSGMTEVARPTLYGAQHPIMVLNENTSEENAEYVVVGHCCESGDLFSCAPGEPETLLPRLLKKAFIGDLIAVDGSGAYCSSMNTKNYNSFPECPEVMLGTDGKVHLIRRRQTMEQMLANEIPY
jgi:diaminopimelate decarboxylase